MAWICAVLMPGPLEGAPEIVGFLGVHHSLPGSRSDAYPTSDVVACALSRAILEDRAARQPWRAISAKMSVTRVERIHLAHKLLEVIEEVKAVRVNP